MNEPLAYLNGRIAPFSELALPLHDAGFVSGATVVDNARTYARRLFRWRDHQERFRHDCAACRIPLELTDERLTEIAHHLLAHNAPFLPPEGELQLVTFATPGPLAFYVGQAASSTAAMPSLPTLGMVTYPVPTSRYGRFATEGVRLAIAGTQSSDAGDLVPPRVKHRSRLVWHLAERTINDPTHPNYSPGAIAVVMSAAGVGDTALGGILAIIDGTLILPVPGTVQQSISAKVVAELCEAAGIPVREQPLDLRTLFTQQRVSGTAVELLLAGTGFGIAGVTELRMGAATCGFPWPGAFLTRLLPMWAIATS